MASYLGNVNESLLALIAQRVVLKEEHDKLVTHWKEQAEEARQLAIALKSSELSSKHLADQHSLKTDEHEMLRFKENKYQRVVKDFENLQNEYYQLVQLSNDYAALIVKLNENIVGKTDNINKIVKQPFIKTKKLSNNNNGTTLKAGEYRLINTSTKHGLPIEELLKQRKSELRNLQQAEKQVHKKLISKLEHRQSADEHIKQLGEEPQSPNEEIVKSRRDRDLCNIVSQKLTIEEEIKQLNRAKQHMALNLQLKTLQDKRQAVQTAANESLAQARMLLLDSKNFLAAQVPLPSINAGKVMSISDTPVHGIDVTPVNKNKSVLYCVLCRSEFQQPNTPCRIHFKIFRNGKFTCCGETSLRKAGCLYTNHCFVQINKNKALLTDGHKSLQLTSTYGNSTV